MLMVYYDNARVYEERRGIDMMERATEMINQTIKEFKNEGDIKTKDISDGYHTFGELYHHRAVLFSVILNNHKDKAWKSWLHHDGTMFDGMFIVGIQTDEGQYSYHYNPEYWDMFEVEELPNAPEYDGHMPSDIDRLSSLIVEL